MHVILTKQAGMLCPTVFLVLLKIVKLLSTYKRC